MNKPNNVTKPQIVKLLVSAFLPDAKCSLYQPSNTLHSVSLAMTYLIINFPTHLI